MNNSYKIFISHSGIDTCVARQIETHVNKLGASSFLDDGHIDVGDDFEKIILNEIQNSEELLVLFTPWARERPYVWLEIGAAWGLNKRIIVVLYGLSPEDISAEGGNPALLKKTNLIDINNLDKYFQQLNKRLS